MVGISFSENPQLRREDPAMSQTRLKEKAPDSTALRGAGQVKSNAPRWLAPFATQQEYEPLSRSRWVGLLSSFLSVLALPFVYGGVAGLLALGLWFHLTNQHGLLDPNNKMTLAFFGPLVGGAFLLVFMVVPFCLARKQNESSYEISPTEHDALFQFVCAIADHVGADHPAVIKANLTTQLRVFKGDDDKTVVILGLPLVATLTLRQLAGLLGQQLLPCSKRPEVAYGSFVNMIHDMFARAAYEEGGSEFAVAHWGGIEQQKSSVSIGFIPWVFAKLAELFGATIATNIGREADRCQAVISGSEDFAATHLDMRLLEEVVAMSRDDLAKAKKDGRTIANLPKFYAGRVQTLKARQPEKITQICEELMTPAPSSTAGQGMAERVARIQQLNAPGIFRIDEPASKIFADFGRLCRTVSKKHYETHFADQLKATPQATAAAATPTIQPTIQVPSLDSELKPSATSPPAATSPSPNPRREVSIASVARTHVSRPEPRTDQTDNNSDQNDFRRDADSRDVLKCFLQGDTLVANQEIFLPLQDLTPAKQPHQMLGMLAQARERYLTLARAQQSDLQELSRAIMRERSLQIAETMSAAGLEVRAAALGLGSGGHGAVREARTAHRETLMACRKSVQELREQAVLRCVAAVQLAGVPQLAQQFLRSSNEIERVRTAVKCLADLKSIWPKVCDLADYQRQLRCLWFNLAGNEHVAELTTCINLTSCETMNVLREVHAVLPRFTGPAAVVGLGNFDCGDIPDGTDGLVTATHAANVVDQLQQLYKRCFVVIAELTERVEASLGHAPLPAPTDAAELVVQA